MLSFASEREFAASNQLKHLSSGAVTAFDGLEN